MMTQQFVHKAGSYTFSAVIDLWCSSPDNFLTTCWLVSHELHQT